MLRPRLLSFTFDGSEPAELPLDIAVVPVDAVIVFDSWFNVIVHTGSHVASWVKQVRPNLSCRAAPEGPMLCAACC